MLADLDLLLSHVTIRPITASMRLILIVAALVALAAPAAASANPFAGRKLYVDPNSAAAKQAAAWRTTRPADAAEIDEIATAPQAQWFGDWNPDVAQAVNAHVSAAAAVGRWTLLVAYNIPQRDCGGYSGGGTAEYRAWIREFARGIGSRPAAVVLEPDALAGLDCLSATDQQTRLSLLRDAVAVLRAKPGVEVYLDGGHSAWHPVATTVSRLRAADVARATGFALNVSNFQLTANEVAYGRAVAGQLGGKHFVIDTGRNGLGPNGEWCNPLGRALGPRPTTATGNALVDAFLWIKQPGLSDGPCNGGPAAGAWWADYALGLAKRSPSR
jgi:endoglucanase